MNEDEPFAQKYEVALERLDEMILLLDNGIPIDLWPEHLKSLFGINEELLGEHE